MTAYSKAKMSDRKARVLKALTSSQHRWRTAGAIADETGISITEVTRILERSPEFIRAKKGNWRGEALFARKEKGIVEPSEDPAHESDATAGEDRHTRFTFLVLIPFDASAGRLQATINNAVRESNGEPVFLNQVKAGAAWVDEVTQLIRTSGAVIADVTRRNPNVMFELGIAHGLGKPLVLLFSDAESTNLPSDLLGYQYLTYSPQNLSAFASRLSKTVRQLVQHRGAL